MLESIESLFEMGNISIWKDLQNKWNNYFYFVATTSCELRKLLLAFKDT